MSNEINTLKSLAVLCQHMVENGVPSFGWTEETHEPISHWVATASAMEAKLGRPLNDAEVTLLSLSRGWGPLPWFNDWWKHPLVAKIWPEFNYQGVWYPWEEMEKILLYLVEMAEFEESWLLADYYHQ